MVHTPDWSVVQLQHPDTLAQWFFMSSLIPRSRYWSTVLRVAVTRRPRTAVCNSVMFIRLIPSFCFVLKVNGGGLS